jgi:hypothetical protein
MGLMANQQWPAAAANFPNTNMMSNPAAFMAMPDAFRGGAT